MSIYRTTTVVLPLVDGQLPEAPPPVYIFSEKKSHPHKLHDEKLPYITSQPTTTPQMSISSNRWAHDLCSCGDHTGTCLTATLCPCIVFGRNSDRLDHLRKTGRPHPDPYGPGGCCSDACVVYASCIPCCGCWKLHSELRTEVRERYGIDKRDERWYERVAPVLCCALGLAQESRQIQCEEERIGLVV